MPYRESRVSQAPERHASNPIVRPDRPIKYNDSVGGIRSSGTSISLPSRPTRATRQQTTMRVLIASGKRTKEFTPTGTIRRAVPAEGMRDRGGETACLIAKFLAQTDYVHWATTAEAEFIIAIARRQLCLCDSRRETEHGCNGRSKDCKPLFRCHFILHERWLDWTATWLILEHPEANPTWRRAGRASPQTGLVRWRTLQLSPPAARNGDTATANAGTPPQHPTGTLLEQPGASAQTAGKLLRRGSGVVGQCSDAPRQCFAPGYPPTPPYLTPTTASAARRMNRPERMHADFIGQVAPLAVPAARLRTPHSQDVSAPPARPSG
jgi:hypothetical protein